MTFAEIVRFGANLAHIRETSGWSRSAFARLFTANMTARQRKLWRDNLRHAETRIQKRSLMVEPMSHVLGIPIPVLTTEDLTALTLAELQARFNFDPPEVEKRAAVYGLGAYGDNRK